MPANRSISSREPAISGLERMLRRSSPGAEGQHRHRRLTFKEDVAEVVGEVEVDAGVEALPAVGGDVADEAHDAVDAGSFGAVPRDIMRLHVDDKLVAGEGGVGGLGVGLRLGWDVVVAAAPGVVDGAEGRCAAAAALGETALVE